MVSLSQARFAALLDIGRPKLASIEEGRARLRFGLYRKAWQQWGINARWLATGEGLPVGTSSEGFATVDVPPEALFSKAFAEYCARNPQPFPIGKPIDQRRFSSALLRMIREMEALGEADEKTREELLALPEMRKAMGALANRLSAAIGERDFGKVVHSVDDQKRSGEGESCSLSEQLELRVKNEREENTSENMVDVSNSQCEESGMSKDTWHSLRERVRVLTKRYGAKTALALHLRVSRQMVNRWLEEEGSEPSASKTLDLLDWVRETETQIKKAAKA